MPLDAIEQSKRKPLHTVGCIFKNFSRSLDTLGVQGVFQVFFEFIQVFPPYKVENLLSLVSVVLCGHISLLTILPRI